MQISTVTGEIKFEGLRAKMCNCHIVCEQGHQLAEDRKTMQNGIAMMTVTYLLSFIDPVLSLMDNGYCCTAKVLVVLCSTFHVCTATMN